MEKKFVKILDTRVKLSTIKRYRPINSTRLNIYYNTSRTKVESESFTFKSTMARNKVIDELDVCFGVI